MKRKALLVTLALALVLGGAAQASLKSGPRITFGGIVEPSWAPGAGLPLKVRMDTLIVVFNPNNVKVKGVRIHLFDKYGKKVFTGPLLDGGKPVSIIPRRGWTWITVGMMLGTLPEPWPTSGEASKWTFIITWDKVADPPDRGLVAEIKEYTLPEAIIPEEVWGWIAAAQTLSETSVGAGGVGYSTE